MTSYVPRQQFLGFHNRSKRWSCLVAHRRAGKTVACVFDLLTRALATKKERAQYAYIAPYYAQAKQIAWEYLKSYGADVITKVNESELWVEVNHKARIFLFGADNPNRLRGLYLDGVILDEFADMKPSIWGEVIRPLLADRKGWAVFIGTPKGMNAFHEIYELARTDPEWFSLTLRASTSGLLPLDELADARKSMSDDQYQQEFECSFTAAIRGSYYGELMNQMEDAGRICRVPYDPSYPVFTVWDLGYGKGNAMSIGFFQTQGREPACIDYLEGEQTILDHWVAEIKAKPYTIYSAHVLPHDAEHGNRQTGFSDKEQLANLGLDDLHVLPRDDIQPGINLTMQLLRKLVMDDEKTKFLRDALKNYQQKWDEERKVFTGRPFHNWASNGADMMRYAATYIAMEQPGIVRPHQITNYGSRGELGWMG